MKILTSKQIKEIDNITNSIYDFIHNLPNDSIKKPFEKIDAICELNKIRLFLDLPGIISLSIISSSGDSASNPPMSEVKPPRGGISTQAEHEHNFQVVSNNAHSICVMCTKCAATKYISSLPPLSTLSQEEQNNDE